MHTCLQLFIMGSGIIFSISPTFVFALQIFIPRPHGPSILKGPILLCYVIECYLVFMFFSSLIVTKSKCSTYVGTAGIVAKETKNMFYLITEDDKMKGD